MAWVLLIVKGLLFKGFVDFLNLAQGLLSIKSLFHIFIYEVQF